MTQKKLLHYFLLILFLTLADQTSKTILIPYLKNHHIELLPFLNLVHTWNYGISFGLFREHYQYSNYLFLGLNSFIIIYLAYILYSSKSALAQIGMAFVIGGAFGNQLDRIFRGAVFDFLHFHYREFSFFVFNLADSFVTIGACLFIYSYIRSTTAKAPN